MLRHSLFQGEKASTPQHCNFAETPAAHIFGNNCKSQLILKSSNIMIRVAYSAGQSIVRCAHIIIEQ